MSLALGSQPSAVAKHSRSCKGTPGPRGSSQALEYWGGSDLQWKALVVRFEESG